MWHTEELSKSFTQKANINWIKLCKQPFQDSGNQKGRWKVEQQLEKGLFMKTDKQRGT